MEDMCFTKFFTGYLTKACLLLQTVEDKNDETLGRKIRFPCVMGTFPNHSYKTIFLSFLFRIGCTDHNASTSLNWGGGGIRKLTL